MQEPLSPKLQEWIYFTGAFLFGGLSALASLLGSSQPLSHRVLVAYILSGGLVSLGIVTIAIVRYGPSSFLIGISIFAGYKAFDLLAFFAAQLRRFSIGATPPPSPDNEKPTSTHKNEDS